MPPHRRRPVPTSGQAPPVRRPKVAGLRNRPSHDEPPESVEDETQPPAETEERESGVLAGDLDTTRDDPDGTTDLADETSSAGVTSEAELADEAGPAAETRSAGATRGAGGTKQADEPDAGDDEPEEPAKPRPKAAATRAPVPARPAGKRRTSGAARPTDLAAAEQDTGAQSKRPARHARVDDRPTRTPAQRQISVAIVLAVVAVILGGLAVFFRGQVDNLTSGDSNSSLTDSAGTSQVVGQLSDAIKKTFSYNYTDLDSTEKAVKEVLSGKALCEYNLLFGELKQYAPQQKIILATTVREIGVVRLEGDRAEALVYIDQQSTRADVNKTVYVGGQFAVQAQRQDNRWKITKFDMFGQALINGKPAPTC